MASGDERDQSVEPASASSGDGAPDGPESSDAEASRRKFLARATMAMGGIIGAVMTVPLVRYLLYPVHRKVVQSADEPVDVIAAGELKVGDHPKLVVVNSDAVRDAWSVSAAPLGAVWLRKVKDAGGAEKVEALSSACPHLGCAVGYDKEDKKFKCPCHRSAFSLNGDKLTGPSKRGMDPIEAKVDAEGRVKVTFKKYRPDISGREEV